MESQKAKDVCRLEQPEKRTFGWYVRVRHLGKTHSRFFADKKHGGRYRAFLAAVAWRDQKEAHLGKVRTDRRVVSKPGRSNTGVIGVRFCEKYDRYEAHWVDRRGHAQRTSVSVRKHGKAKAFEWAKKIREEKERERVSLAWCYAI